MPPSDSAPTKLDQAPATEVYGPAGLVRAKLPPALSRLEELAFDLRWTWSHAGDALWSTIDGNAWAAMRNPWALLQATAGARLRELASSDSFVTELERLVADRATYLAAKPYYPAAPSVAYFCMEFGLGAAMPLYAGGLGILAGDYLKTASDLGVPAVGVGILYQEGYFRQMLDASGRQHETYSYVDPGTLPIQPAASGDGTWARVSVDLSGRKLWLKIWRARVGRAELLLLDANDPANALVDRGITEKLYGGSQEMRLQQEIVLGIGGFRALSLLGLNPRVVHLNEGHAALVVLERARQFALAEHTSFHEALWATRAANVFTTHTPVSAGFDTFSPALIEKYFPSSGEYLAKIQLATEDILTLGRRNPSDIEEPFAMTFLAMRGSAFVNGVSRVHAEVTRGQLSQLFPRYPECEVPISHVTNGVHVPSWDSAAADELWTRTCGKERWTRPIAELCGPVAALEDGQIWALRGRERRDLVLYARSRLEAQLAFRGDADAARAKDVLDPNALTLGFARRFAEYKRPNLLLADQDRFARILCDSRRPVQIVVAGKAHPADETGKRMIAEWIAFVSRPDVRARAVFLEDYDMAIAEKLVAGVDLWLNTPRRPWEARGTSGMKVLANGGLNLSELDGWWAEAFSAECGWALGSETSPSDGEDARQLYALLENEIVPAFYDRDASEIPRAWVARIRMSMSRLAPAFSSNRMLMEYATRFYTPAAEAFERRTANGAALARELSRWGERLSAQWRQIHFGFCEVQPSATGCRFRIGVYLGEVPPESIRVELYADAQGTDPVVRANMKRDGALPGATGGHLYEATIATARPSTDFTARVIPYHPDAFVPLELPLIVWQQ